jgi:hypothetical protein
MQVGLIYAAPETALTVSRTVFEETSVSRVLGNRVNRSLCEIK